MIDIGLEPKVRTSVAKCLNEILADEYVLYTKTLKCHWNVTGKHFGAMHEFFKEQYEQLFTINDDVAERARALDVMALGTLTEFAKMTSLSEHPGENPGDLAMVAWLLADHESIICSLRDHIKAISKLGDEGTANFLTDLMEKHEKMAWMLRSFLVK